VVRAALGQREADDGTVSRVADAERRAARRQAAWIVARAAMAGIAVAALAWCCLG